jgi:hypothetical protein
VHSVNLVASAGDGAALLQGLLRPAEARMLARSMIEAA